MAKAMYISVQMWYLPKKIVFLLFKPQNLIIKFHYIWNETDYLGKENLSY